MGAGVAELMDQLAKVEEQLAAAALPELLAKKAALEAELKAAKAKKSAATAAAGAYGLYAAFSARPKQFLQRLPPHAPLASRISHTIHAITRRLGAQEDAGAEAPDFSLGTPVGGVDVSGGRGWMRMRLELEEARISLGESGWG
jgi:hypothetical protein